MQTTDIPQQYTVSNAMHRLINRFKSDKIYVKAEDLNALKTIAEALNFFFEDIKRTDNLYFKLSAKLFAEYLPKHKSWQIATKALIRDLQMPISFYEMMVKSNSDMVLCLEKWKEFGLENDASHDITQDFLKNLNEDNLEDLSKASLGTPQEDINSLLYRILGDLFIEYNATDGLCSTLKK